MSDKITALPDGSAFSILSLPLPSDHWLYAPQEGWNDPPAGLLCGTDDPNRAILVEHVRAAARYAVRGATMNGTVMDFDPDALVQNMIVGLFGYCTSDGLPGER